MKYRDKTRKLLRTLKEVPCHDCRNEYPYYVMDFDHTRGEKLFTISTKINTPIALQKLLDEIAKCDVVCANCHRIRTYKRSNGM